MCELSINSINHSLMCCGSSTKLSFGLKVCQSRPWCDNLWDDDRQRRACTAEIWSNTWMRPWGGSGRASCQSSVKKAFFMLSSLRVRGRGGGGLITLFCSLSNAEGAIRRGIGFERFNRVLAPQIKLRVVYYSDFYDKPWGQFLSLHPSPCHIYSYSTITCVVW